jgi:hypothetical protein
MSFWSDIVSDVQLIITSAAGGETQAQLQAAGAPDVSLAGPFTGLVHVVEAIWTELTDGKMWRSVGWLLLGVALMLLGVAWWIGPSAARRSPLGLAAEGLA